MDFTECWNSRPRTSITNAMSLTMTVSLQGHCSLALLKSYKSFVVRKCLTLIHQGGKHVQLPPNSGPGYHCICLPSAKHGRLTHLPRRQYSCTCFYHTFCSQCDNQKQLGCGGFNPESHPSGLWHTCRSPSSGRNDNCTSKQLLSHWGDAMWDGPHYFGTYARNYRVEEVRYEACTPSQITVLTL
jgi:hypothetical protein